MDSFDNINNFVNIVKSMQNQEEHSNMKTDERRTLPEDPSFFDDFIYTSELKTLKSMVSYLEPEMQKKMGAMIKVMELNMFMNNFNHTKAKKNNNENWKFEMLNSMKVHMPPDKQKMIESITQIMLVSEMMKKNEG